MIVVVLRVGFGCCVGMILFYSWLMVTSAAAVWFCWLGFCCLSVAVLVLICFWWIVV